MAIRFRRRKRDESSHPQYLDTRERKWFERDRERGGRQQAQRSFARIIGLCIVLLVLVIAAIVTAGVSASGGVSNEITAADTYAVTSAEQSAMQSTATDFMSGMLVFSYCSDEEEAMGGKEAALACVAPDTETYSLIERMSFPGGGVSPDDLAVVIGNVSMSDGTRAYAGSYTYEARGSVADTSVTDGGNDDGTLVDQGYSFTMSFSRVTDENGANPKWMISYATIDPA